MAKSFLLFFTLEPELESKIVTSIAIHAAHHLMKPEVAAVLLQLSFIVDEVSAFFSRLIRRIVVALSAFAVPKTPQGGNLNIKVCYSFCDSFHGLFFSVQGFLSLLRPIFIMSAVFY